MNCISEINNTQLVSVKFFYIVISAYKLFKYNKNYSSTFGNLWQCYRDERSDPVTDSESFKLKLAFTEKNFY